MGIFLFQSHDPTSTIILENFLWKQKFINIDSDAIFISLNTRN